ncbi:NAD(P)-dependent oxidoreductase [Paraburkholderia dipogonis]|uniref:NAD(P)-dependent oxidoreductase n=1 Tax=Paraburkholderia dipogonis TaxID=1211383 RepID=A0ABW9B4Y3_9BURK
MTARTILFLDDDPVVRIARSVLCNESEAGWLREYFAPEVPDLAPLVDAAQGITREDGIRIQLADGADLRDYDPTVIVFRRGVVTAESVAACGNLKLIQRLGERPEGIDLEAARSRGVVVSCLPRRTLDFTAEHALLLMLALGKKLVASDRLVRTRGALAAAGVNGVAYNWPGIGGLTGLHGKTLGVVGLGEVGTLVVKLARAFGMKVIYTKRKPLSQADETALGASFDTLPNLLDRADFVSLHAANLPENRGMMGRAEFAAMRPHAFFVSTSRGALVDEDALFDALRSGAIAGAGLDVHEVEPRPANDRFCALENVVLTPHVAGGSRAGLLPELRTLIQNCRAAFDGAAFAHRIA